MSRLADLMWRLRPQVGLAAVAAGVWLAMMTGALTPIEDGLATLRFKALQRAPSHQITVVEIDVPSLRAAGRWPWGRDRFATAIGNLQAAGAKVVAFDVDFSANATAATDKALAEAIGARPGSVILPTFVQPERRPDGGVRLVETSPLRGLSTEALLASVNVPIDSDGRVRRYTYGFGVDETYRPSMGASLAQAPQQRRDSFLIDYSAKLGEIDHLSFEDVFRNRFDPRLVRGRSILIGATALELGDEFATPPAGTVNGVYLHALAFENLTSGRALTAPPAWMTYGLACLLILFLRADREPSLRRLSRRHATVGVGLVALPILLQNLAPISLSVAPLLAAQLLCLLWATQAELARRARSIIAEREAGLLHQAMHEPETGLPNRRALLLDIGSHMQGDQTDAVAVVAIGIDRFPTMRGAIGYSLSNLIVRGVAARLEAICGDVQVAHLSTSVIGLVLRRADTETLLADLKRIEDLDPGHEVAGHPVDAFVKLGVSHRTSQEDEAERLLENAALALDEARRLNWRVVTFEAETYADPTSNLALMTEMRRGLQAGEISLHYQPKLTTADGGVHGVEALIRWKHPVRGNIPPDSFIGVAEETGNIRELTEWTLERALADRAALSASGQDLIVSVNISGRLLADRSFCDHVQAMVAGRDHGLCLEITETAVIENPTAATASIAAFRAAGLKVSIDDYGIGLSSLSYLKMLEADELKIDKSLVVAVAESQRDRLILKSTIDLAHSLGMSVVAEGVETHEVQAALALLGCDAVQGYLISRPVPLDDLRAFLAAWGQAPDLAATG
ncbi:MAG: EAL domain-containing protein [Phenylobacterium sp.]|uniref:putative bifunctional diguanylate cyclase/phosphodiesterase n=1 Tax=Phenylobacterium sp. TaxID=1871053 RepID=UPI001B60CC82|nr:EAL domain-containing protein [Phenylobacterium sp.]MBP7817239.1 EAL domain-containing protein [Phenylobacterium sp.]